MERGLVRRRFSRTPQTVPYPTTQQITVRVARSVTTGDLLALPGAPESDRRLASRIVHGEEARRRTSDLRCVDIHCAASVIYRQGETRAARWAHKAGEGTDCTERETGEGEWHRMVCRSILAGAAGHEHSARRRDDAGCAKGPTADTLNRRPRP